MAIRTTKKIVKKIIEVEEVEPIAEKTEPVLLLGILRKVGNRGLTFSFIDGEWVRCATSVEKIQAEIARRNKRHIPLDVYQA